MAEFEQLRDELAIHRQRSNEYRQEALLDQEALKRAERALAEFARTQDPRRGDERARLEEAVKDAQSRVDRARNVLADSRTRESTLEEEFKSFLDPREGLRRWPDHYPILLFPLRLETRFKEDKNGKPQLWVRVFPDTCLIDSFEPSLTEQEVASARSFWAAIWRAGGEESRERTAWRDLVASHGSGRSSWVVRQYQPLNPNEKPVKDSPTDVLLVIIAPGPLPAATADYWRAVWKEDTTAQRKAYAAIEDEVGADQAREIAKNYQPFNFADPPAPPRTRDEVQVKVAILQLTPPGRLRTRGSSWSSAPRVDLLPERFVFVGYSGTNAPLTVLGNPIRVPLVAGPDPNALPEEQLKPVDDTLQIPDALAWMFDFEKAFDAGMAFRLDLTREQARAGFDRVVVLGLRLVDSPAQGQQNLERLLERHLYSRAGLEIVPQGTPTNNTERGGSGYTFHDDSDATFGTFFRQTPQYTLESDPLLRRDGQWLAEFLGLRHDLAQRIPNGGGTDQGEARAMQIALWPGTLGYMMKTVLAPVFSDQEIAHTRSFFTRYVSGRGPLPALRIGAQPYGILPTTAFDRINWFDRSEQARYFRKLYTILKGIENDWKPLVGQISHIGQRGGDPHKILLDVLGLHPSSVEYYPLQAESVEHKFYELSFLDFSAALRVLNLFPAAIPLALLRRFGYNGEAVPDLLKKLYKAHQTPLTGPLIDDRPLSETEAIRKYAGNRNYIEWLVDAAQAGIERLQQEQGFDGDEKPVALLYLLLRHALQVAFHSTGVRLQVEAGLVDHPETQLREPAMVHVQDSKESDSHYAPLFREYERITGRAGILLGDYIARNIRRIDPELREQIEALERLSQAPTARLERIFAEHIDTVSYRLDAWKTGLIAWQLEHLRRETKSREGGAEKADQAAGLYLGAYGWLEPLRSENKVLTSAKLPDDVAKAVNRHDNTPLMHDSTNEGLIHAPSLNHATTAAVLRNGYIANGGQLAVNLSSRRVRLALGILEGMRNGQPLGALLGYQFERHVYDHGPLKVRDLVYPLRRAFPLVANQIEKTKSDDGEAKESIAAMNVVDGRKLIEHVEKTNDFVYPFAVSTLPRRAADQELAMTNALAHIRDINDAVADLVLAEGVHQAVLGNYDRSAGTLDAFAKGNYPPEPEVIRTPRSGIALTLRTAIHLSPTPLANPLENDIPVLTPLAAAEPAVNAWLEGRLPLPDNVGCRVTFRDRTTNAETNEFISQKQLGLHPIDLVYLVQSGADQALTYLDDCILQYLHSKRAPRHDREIRINYTERVPDKVTWFELQALLRSLRTLVASRPLRPADLMRHNDTSLDEQSAVSLPKSRVQSARDELQNNLMPALDALATTLSNPAIDIDAALTQFVATVKRFAAFHLPQTGTAFVYEWRASAYSALTRKVQQRVKIWNGRRAQYLHRIDEYDGLPNAAPVEERIRSLQAAEILISTHLTTPVPPVNAYRSALNDRQDNFETKRDALVGLVDNPRATLAELLADAKAQLGGGVLPPLSDFDPDPLNFDDTEKEIARFRTTLADAVTRLKGDVTKRLSQVDALLSRYDTAGATDKVKLLQDAAKFIFGEDFQLVPQITLSPDAIDELGNAWQYSASGKLTDYLIKTVGREFPVDDWLHGVARVRPKLHDWENVVLLSEALQVQEPAELIPLQLPYGPNEPWLALEIPNTLKIWNSEENRYEEVPYKIDGDRLLYTTHFAEPFDKTKPICGLVIDEWTEVIPGREETTGIAFHFDRPNAEPPQTWLLALPAVQNGAWSWEELLAAVNATLDSAKLRAIEPVHIDDTAYSWFLPATLSAYTFPEISISNNLLRNVQLYKKLVKE